jgi:hypothetical protein
MFNAPPLPHCFSPEHEAFRDALGFGNTSHPPR